MLQQNKLVDLLGQLLCLFVPVALGLLLKDDTYYLVIYLTVSGWQSLSFLINAITMKEKQKANLRKVYGVLLLLILSSLLLFFVVPNAAYLLLFVYGLLIPIMAVMYFVVTLREMHMTYSKK